MLNKQLNKQLKKQSVKLTNIAIGAYARVTGYTYASPYVEQLKRLGVVPGTRLQLIRRAPLGDPVEIRIRGFSLALRPAEADELELELIAADDAADAGSAL